MYTLLSGLYKYVFQKDEYCILILGLDNAGKTVSLSHSSFLSLEEHTEHRALPLIVSVGWTAAACLI